MNISIPKKSNVFQVVNEEKKEVLLFFNDRETVRTLRFNNKMELLDSINGNRPSDNYDEIVGYSASGNSIFPIGRVQTVKNLHLNVLIMKLNKLFSRHFS